MVVAVVGAVVCVVGGIVLVFVVVGGFVFFFLVAGRVVVGRLDGEVPMLAAPPVVAGRGRLVPAPRVEA